MIRCVVRVWAISNRAGHGRVGEILVTALLLAAALLGSSCLTKGKIAKRSKDLAGEIARSRSSQQQKANQTSRAEEHRVYLDASFSMKGFVNSRDHSTFEELLDEVGNALPGCLLYRYGQSGEAPPKSVGDLISRTGFGLELHDPRFYNLQFNPDDRLIEFLVNEDRPVFSALMTDGVYSEPAGSTAPPVVDAIKKWMMRGGTFGILIFKSSFSGPFYSERRRGTLPFVSVAARPFYTFVFSPTEQEFRDLEDKLRRRFHDIKTIVFTDEAVTCSIEIPEPSKWEYSSKKADDLSYRWQMLTAGLVAKPDPSLVSYTIAYQCSPDYPVAELKPTLSTDYYRWVGGQFTKVEGGAPAGFAVRVTPRNANDGVEPKAVSQPGSAPRIVLTADPRAVGGETRPTVLSPSFFVSFPKDTSTDYSFYQVSVNTTISSLQPYILELSTRDDSARENAGKTFRLFELITALADVHFTARLAAKSSPSLFVTIEND